MTAQNVKLIFIFIAAQEEKKALEEAEEQFTCKDGSTIPETHYCDDLFDCPDNSDEGHQCKQAPSCQKMKCSNSCSISWKGPKCFCPSGLIPAPDDPTACVDLNECEVSKSVKKAQKVLEIAKNWAYNFFF